MFLISDVDPPYPDVTMRLSLVTHKLTPLSRLVRLCCASLRVLLPLTLFLHGRDVCFTNLTFRGPCIAIYSYTKSQQDALISQIYFWNRTLLVSDRFSVHHQESNTVYTAKGVCHTSFADCLLAGSGSEFHPDPASEQSVKPVWHIHVAVNTVLDSWWWTENLSKTCRVLFQKYIWVISATCWFY